MKPSPLPPEFIGLQGQVNYVQQASQTEFCSSCPKCGGAPHQLGELPDRFRMFLNGRNGKIVGWCRKCNFLWFPDMADNYDPPTPQELEQWRQKQEQTEEARLRSAQRALDNLRSAKLWEQYSEMSGKKGRAWWERRGVPYPFQVMWQLGWDYDLSRWGCASATIPLFDHNGDCLNIKHRLADDSKGRYRYNVTGQDAPMFLTDPDLSLDNHVIAVEGEVKAAVAYITLDDPHACIVGIPGLNPPASITDTLAKADRITLVLDPDSDARGADGWSAAGRLVKAIGRSKCQLVVPSMKIDDALLAMQATKWDVRRLLRQAVEM